MAFRILLTSLAMFAGILAASAQLPVARLHAVSPAGGQIGSTFEVSISGADLDGVMDLRFSDTNVTAKAKILSETSLAEPNRFVVTISSNALPGKCEMRAAGRFGVSNPRFFAFGQHGEAAERGDNHTATNAMDMTVGTTVNAQADANAFDYFRFAATKGQRVLIECQARSIDSRMEPLMLLYDGMGREIERARNRDFFVFDAPETGTNVLRVSDLLYRGGSEYFYRLTIQTGPRVEFVMPPSAPAGTTNKHLVYGWNLPGSTPATNMTMRGKPLDKLELEIVAPGRAEAQLHGTPAALGIEGFHYHVKTGATVSDPVFIGLSSSPVFLETTNNDRGETAQTISLPCEIAGQLYPAGDQDWFAFDARKGDVYWLEIFSERLGAPADPMLVVQRVTKSDKGELKVSDVQESYDGEGNIGGQEFKTSSRDPAWRFEVKDDGTYRAQVRDLFNRTSAQPGSFYRLAVRKETPGFSLAVLHSLPPTKKEREVAPWTTVLRRGETLPLRVLAQRRDGFNGEIALSVANCPPEVTASPTKIESGKNSALLFLTAQANATNWGGLIKVFGKGKHGSNELTQAAIEGAHLWRVEDYNTEAVATRTSPDVVLGTTPETAPVIIAVTATNALEAVAGTKLQIPVVITRYGDFSEKLKLKLAGAQPLESAKEVEVDGKATNATFDLDLSQAKLAPGTHFAYFQTQSKGKYSNDSDGAKAAELTAKEAETNATSLATDARKATEAAATAARAVIEAEAAVKIAMEKLAAAKSAAEANTNDVKLSEALKDGEKALGEVTAKGKSAAEAKADAKKASVDLAAKSKIAEARKTALAARAKELSEKAKPREVTVGVYSRPFEIKINAAPVTTKK
jgi:hypothetical protein